MQWFAPSRLIMHAACAALIGLRSWGAAPAHGGEDPIRIVEGGATVAVVGPLRDLDSHCPFEPPTTVDAWKQRAESLRDQVRVSLGLWPMPTLPPLAPQVRGRVVLDGYAVEKVTFESLPGLIVTGNLYRPDPLPPGRTVPAVLCPHGHWPNGRFQDVPAKEVAVALTTGGERFEAAARNPIQARCVQLARMGCVVFQWDMLGYCDSTQISLERVHRFAAQDPATEVTADGWLLFSPLAEAHCQSVMGLQSLITLRSVDFVLSLPEVDPARIGITGASGGGTQSFVAAAIDPRIAVAFPAVMVGTGMQGGCTCENACGLRIGTGNVELAALIAPRPLGLTAADDWTRAMPEDGFPQLQRVYEMLDAADRTMLEAALQFGHNYNVVGRTAMYGWMNRHFALGLPTPVLERDFSRLGEEQLTVWNHEHPAPAGGLDFERRLLREYRDLVANEIDRLVAAGDAERYRDIVGTGWKVVLGLTAADILPATATPAGDEVWDFGSPSDGTWTLRCLSARGAAAPGKAAVTITCTPPDGAAPVRYAPALAGQTWDHDGAWVSAASQPLVANPRLAAPYTYCYNLPLVARRARQLAATLAWLRIRHPGALIEVHGHGEAAGLAAAGVFCAVCSAPERATDLRLAIDPAGFRFASAESIRAAHFLPGSARFLDVPGLVGCLPVATAVSGADTVDFEHFGRLIAAHGGRLETRADSP